MLLAAAFGVVEAGLVDQSMFSPDYRGIPYWSDMADPTYVAPIGLSIFLAVTFVGEPRAREHGGADRGRRGAGRAARPATRGWAGR